MAAQVKLCQVPGLTSLGKVQMPWGRKRKQGASSSMQAVKHTDRLVATCDEINNGIAGSFGTGGTDG